MQFYFLFLNAPEVAAQQSLSRRNITNSVLAQLHHHMAVAQVYVIVAMEVEGFLGLRGYLEPRELAGMGTVSFYARVQGCPVLIRFL